MTLVLMKRAFFTRRRVVKQKELALVRDDSFRGLSEAFYKFNLNLHLNGARDCLTLGPLLPATNRPRAALHFVNDHRCILVKRSLLTHASSVDEWKYAEQWRNVRDLVEHQRLSDANSSRSGRSFTSASLLSFLRRARPRMVKTVRTTSQIAPFSQMHRNAFMKPMIRQCGG